MHTLILALGLLYSMTAQAQSNSTTSATDLQPIIGSWQGTLTYLDYTSNKPFTMPANIVVERIGKSNKYLFKNSFPKEPNANWTDTVAISADSTMINDEPVTSRRVLNDGNLEIVTEVLGIDGNEKKPALLRHTYLIGRTLFSLRKDVRFVGETDWIRRHEYAYPVKVAKKRR